MGTWGASLFSDDYARDVRDDYIEAQKKGMSCEEATQEVLANNTDAIGTDDEPLLWYALASTQWDYGQLTPEIKEKALYFLDNGPADDRWDTPQLIAKRTQVLNNLREKLLSPQPKKKKIRKYNFYKCPWKLGDVYAYQFHTKYAKEAGLTGRYVVFRKITEEWSWPGHIIPVVHLYAWMGNSVPTLDEVKKLPILETKPTADNEVKRYLYGIIIESKRSVSQGWFTYIGNIQDDQLIEYREGIEYEGRGFCIFESVFIDRYPQLFKEGAKSYFGIRQV